MVTSCAADGGRLDAGTTGTFYLLKSKKHYSLMQWTLDTGLWISRILHPDTAKSLQEWFEDPDSPDRDPWRPQIITY